MEADSRALQDVVARLRRVEGQVGGIVRMIEGGRECRDVVLQLAAVSRALDRAGLKLIAAQLRSCLQAESEGRPSGYEPEELERLFMSLA